MKTHVYALFDACSGKIVKIAWSVLGAVVIAENDQLTLDDGASLTLDGLERRLVVDDVVLLYVARDPEPVGRIERHWVGP